MNRSGTHALYRREVADELFHEISFQLFERNIFYTVFVFEEKGKAFTVIVIVRIGAVFAHTFEEACEVFVEGLQHRAVEGDTPHAGDLTRFLGLPFT